jgi:hypothetical protein
MDNAGNCNTTAEDLHVLIPWFGGMLWCMCCFLHIVNLIVKVCPNSFIRSIKLTQLHTDFFFSGVNTNRKKLSKFLKLPDEHMGQLLLPMSQHY